MVIRELNYPVAQRRSRDGGWLRPSIWCHSRVYLALHTCTSLVLVVVLFRHVFTIRRSTHVLHANLPHFNRLIRLLIGGPLLGTQCTIRVGFSVFLCILDHRTKTIIANVVSVKPIRS